MAKVSQYFDQIELELGPWGSGRGCVAGLGEEEKDGTGEWERLLGFKLISNRGEGKDRTE